MKAILCSALLALLLTSCARSPAAAPEPSSAPSSAVRPDVAAQSDAPAAATPTPEPALAGKILFSKNHDLWLYANGTARQLTALGGVENPAWSPDGSEIAFDRLAKNSADLYLMRYPDGQPQALTNNSSPIVNYNFWEMQPSWSPDGQALVYVSDRGRTQTGTLDLAVFRMVIATRARTQLTGANLYTGGADHPAWSPSGADILYTSWVYSQGALEPYGALVDLNLGRHTEDALTATGETAMQPSWSPDGQAIAVVRRSDKQDQIWIIPAPSAASVRLQQILPGPAAAASLAGRAASASAAASPSASAETDAFLQGAPVVASGMNAHPVWSPDGRALAYLSLSNGSFDLFVQSVTADLQPDGPPRQLTFGLHIDADSAISWSR